MPPSVHPTCIGCGGTKLEEVDLPLSGVVHTFVVNHTMPAPFVAPLPLVVVDLDGTSGARCSCRACQRMPRAGGRRSGAVELRRYAVERGVPVYGYKVVRDGGAS